MPMIKLLVEGKDDEIVLKKLIDHHFSKDISTKISIQNFGGIDDLLTSIPVQLKASDIKSLGIVVDADTSLEARWQSIKDRLLHAGYSNVPNAPHSSGTILFGDMLPNVGIWVMPNNRLQGSLEDFVSFLVPQDDDLWLYAIECLSKITVKDYSKSLIHTWLAWQDQPGKPFGQAITMKYLDPDADYSVCLSRWIKTMLEASGLVINSAE